LASATSLESLYLDGRQVGDGVAAALVDKEHLQKLCLRNAGIGPSGAEALARSHLLARLGWLDLSVNPLGDAGASALTTATFAASLTRVSLERCAVGPAGVAALASAMPNLISLGLAGNPIGDEGARLLAGCPQLVQLEELKLSGCGIGTDGATALLDSPHLARAAIITGTAPDAEVRRRLRERRAIREPFLAL
jgi:hypothetical protein